MSHSKSTCWGRETFLHRHFRRTTRNTACALTDYTHRSQATDNHRLATTLYCHDVLPVGTDKDLRDALLLEQVTSLLAHEFDVILQRRKSNDAVEPFGNNKLIRSDHFRRLDLDVIAADAARMYLPQTESILETNAAPSIVEELDWQETIQPCPVESIEALIDQALERDADDLVHAAAETSVSVVSEPVLILIGDLLLNLADSSTFSLPLQSVAQATDRMRRLRTALLTIEQTADALQQQALDLGRQLDRGSRSARASVRDLQGLTLGSLVRSDVSRIERAEDALLEVRETRDALTVCDARLQAALQAAESLQQKIESMEERLESLLDNLEDSLPQGEIVPGPACSIPQQIDEFFPELWNLAIGPAAPIRELLQQAAEFITLEGLAEITGARTVSTEAVIEEVLSGRNAQRGPAWGGEPRFDQGVCCLVYPRVTPQLADVLRAHHTNRCGDEIAFTNRVLGSVNITKIEVTTCTQLEDVITPLYRKAIPHALASDLRPLYAANEALAKSLGIDVPGNGEAPSKDSH